MSIYGTVHKICKRFLFPLCFVVLRVPREFVRSNTRSAKRVREILSVISSDVIWLPKINKNNHDIQLRMQDNIFNFVVNTASNNARTTGPRRNIKTVFLGMIFQLQRKDGRKTVLSLSSEFLYWWDDILILRMAHADTMVSKLESRIFTWPAPKGLMNHAIQMLIFDILLLCSLCQWSNT